MTNNKEKHNQIIDEVYENYLEKYKQDKTPGIVYYTDPLQYRPYTKEEFTNKIKIDKKFPERWGLKIEERELEQRERVKLLQKAWKSNDISPEHEEVSTMWIEYKNLMEKYNIPTKLITVTYNNETVEIYG